ncbi:hypothetical protein [Actinomadura sp. 6N118]|uniref:hypothetical protein n=1 Tax=Actinomadura sp. 6N118 TaxID=3375151 RepID=UPI0037BC5DD7
MTGDPSSEVLRQRTQLNSRVRVQLLAGDVLRQGRNVVRRGLPLTVALSPTFARRPVRPTVILTRTARATVAVTEGLTPASATATRPVTVAERLTRTRATPVVSITVWTRATPTGLVTVPVRLRSAPVIPVPVGPSLPCAAPVITLWARATGLIPVLERSATPVVSIAVRLARPGATTIVIRPRTALIIAITVGSGAALVVAVAIAPRAAPVAVTVGPGPALVVAVTVGLRPALVVAVTVGLRPALVVAVTVGLRPALVIAVTVRPRATLIVAVAIAPRAAPVAVTVGPGATLIVTVTVGLTRPGATAIVIGPGTALFVAITVGLGTALVIAVAIAPGAAPVAVTVGLGTASIVAVAIGAGTTPVVAITVGLRPALVVAIAIGPGAALVVTVAVRTGPATTRLVAITEWLTAVAGTPVVEATFAPTLTGVPILPEPTGPLLSIAATPWPTEIPVLRSPLEAALASRAARSLSPAFFTARASVISALERTAWSLASVITLTAGLCGTPLPATAGGRTVPRGAGTAAVPLSRRPMTTGATRALSTTPRHAAAWSAALAGTLSAGCAAGFAPPMGRLATTPVVAPPIVLAAVLFRAHHVRHCSRLLHGPEPHFDRSKTCVEGRPG